MIKLLLLIAALIAGIVVGPDLAGSQGYVLISFAEQTIEMSLTTLVILIVALLALFFIVEFILRGLFSMGSSTRGWFSQRKARKARTLTADGLVKVIEGDWKQAEKLVTKAAKNSDAPVLNYLAAAEASQELGNTDQRDEYLKRAAECDGQNLAVGLVRAKLQIRQQQYEQALATLQEIKRDNGRNLIVLNLLKECYIQLEDWKALLEILPQLEKDGVITTETKNQLELDAQRGLMAQIAKQSGSDGLMSHWNGLNRKLKQQSVLVAAFVEQMINCNADNDAYTVLREYLKKTSDDTLINLVPKLKLSDNHPAIVRLQDLLRHDSRNAATHSALGQMFAADGKWQEAKEHFTQAVALRPDVSDYAHLVQALENLDDSQAAAQASRQALNLALPAKI